MSRKNKKQTEQEKLLDDPRARRFMWEPGDVRDVPPEQIPPDNPPAKRK